MTQVHIVAMRVKILDTLSAPSPKTFSPPPPAAPLRSNGMTTQTSNKASAKKPSKYCNRPEFNRHQYSRHSPQGVSLFLVSLKIHSISDHQGSLICWCRHALNSTTSHSCSFVRRSRLRRRFHNFAIRRRTTRRRYRNFAIRLRASPGSSSLRRKFSNVLLPDPQGP